MNEIKGWHNIWFRGADELIALLEYHNIKWKKEGLTVTAIGVSKEFVDLVMEVSKQYNTF